MFSLVFENFLIGGVVGIFGGVGGGILGRLLGKNDFIVFFGVKGDLLFILLLG